MDLNPVKVLRKEDRRSWIEIDKNVNNRDDSFASMYRKTSTPLSVALFSQTNIRDIQIALRKYIMVRTAKRTVGGKGIDIGMQNSGSITNELAKWYYDLKYNDIAISGKDLDRAVKNISYRFVVDRLGQTTLNGIEDKMLYNEWALKVPDPFPIAQTDNYYDRSVNMTEYYDESWGGGFSGKGDNEWDWSKSGMYDEPESLYKRYPDPPLSGYR